ncbi:AraC family transcriptional regulator [Paenibacillus hodogayensis]|uniref:AraC family transcriptional regulator n=1 Tax=Paenibacillus hodogayensis TaxID=279208 RepID=A0ABV5VWS6_9BACL
MGLIPTSQGLHRFAARKTAVLARLSAYRLRLVGFTFLIGALPLLAIGYFSYHLFTGELQTKAAQTNLQLLGQTRGELENMLAKIDYGAIQFAGSPYVSEWMRKPLTEENYEAYQALAGMMSKLSSGNPGIRSLTLVNLDYDWAIDRTRLNRLSSLAGMQRYADYASLPNASAWLTESSGEGGNALVFVRKLPVATGAAKPSGLLVAEIDLPEMARRLSEKNIGAILDADYRTLLGAAETPKMKEPLEASVRKFVSDRPDMQGTFRIGDDGSIGVMYTRSPYTGWTIVSVYSLHELRRDASSIGWMTLAACLALLAVTAAFVWFGSKKMYRPVKKLHDILAQAGRAAPGPDRGRFRDDFGQIEQGVAHLMNAESQMRRQVAVVLPQAKELFALQLFTGQLQKEQAEEKRRLLELPGAWERLAVFALQFEPASDAAVSIDRDVILFAIGRLVEETLPAGEYLKPVLLGRTQAVLMIQPDGTEEAWRTELSRRGEAIRVRAAETLGVQASIGVSRPFHSLGEATRAYAEASDALSCRLRFGPGVVVHYDETESDGHRPLADYPEPLERQLLEAVRMSRRDWADEALNAFFRYLVERDVSPGQFHYMTLRLLSGLLDLIRGEAAFLRDLFGGRAALERLAQAESVEEKKEWLRLEVLYPVVELLAARIEEQHDSITKDTLKIIHERFGTELTLESCAAQLHFHPNHVGRVFKKSLGVSFSDYLAQYRLGLSKRWLTETDWKIGDISAKLGYNSSAAFVRYFRNMEGVTPGEYRKKTQAAPRSEPGPAAPAT